MTMEPVYVPRTAEEKKMQRALMQSFKKENAAIVRKALEKAGRTDLLQGRDALIPGSPSAADPRGRKDRRSPAKGPRKKVK